MVEVFGVLFLAYLLGCFTTGYYLVRLKTGIDIRDTVSGNVGSRNVGRLLGAQGFVITFIGDAGKGLLAVWLAAGVGKEPWLPSAALLVVVAGHIWPIQLGFRGGKGFAAFAGGMLLLDPVVLLCGLCLSLLFLTLLRKTTISGLIALACSPLLMTGWRVYRHLYWLDTTFAIYSLLVAIVLLAHRRNICDYIHSHGKITSAGEHS